MEEYNLFGEESDYINDEEESSSNIIIHGDVNIEIHSDEKDVATIGGMSLKQLRNLPSMKNWRKRVKNRDKNKCQCCGSDQKLEIHHIMPLAKYKGLGNDTNNGITLCHTCHSKYHELYKNEENGATFAIFLKNFGSRIYGG